MPYLAKALHILIGTQLPPKTRDRLEERKKKKSSTNRSEKKKKLATKARISAK
jgi:hypothetical protein